MAREGSITGRMRSREANRRAEGEGYSPQEESVQKQSPTGSVHEPLCSCCWRPGQVHGARARMVSLCGKTRMSGQRVWTQFCRLWDAAPPEPGLGRMDFWGPGETELGLGWDERDKQASGKGRRPEGMRAFARALRAVVSLFGNSSGETRRKMAKGTGLGLGQQLNKRSSFGQGGSPSATLCIVRGI